MAKNFVLNIDHNVSQTGKHGQLIIDGQMGDVDVSNSRVAITLNISNDLYKYVRNVLTDAGIDMTGRAVDVASDVVDDVVSIYFVKGDK